MQNNTNIHDINIHRKYQIITINNTVHVYNAFILSVNSILVNLDVISGSYVNGIAQHTIYSFFPNVSPGHKIVENPKTVIYLPITLHVIHSIQITLEDQDGNQLDLRGEKITIRFHIREK